MVTLQSVRGTLYSLMTVAKLRASGVRFPSIADPPAAGRVGLLIGPKNSAGQGDAWARAAARVDPDIDARSMAFVRENTFRFSVDQPVDSGYAAHSAKWQRRQFAVVSRFDAVLIESAAPPFSGLWGGDTRAQIRQLEAAGVKVGLVFHGSDIRDPDWHLLVEPHSHYADSAAYAQNFRAVSSRSRRLVAESGLPVFVSTAGMVTEVPGATWLPVVVDPDRWKRSDPPFQGVEESEGSRPLRVAHVPSDSHIKGTKLIAEPLDRLQREGLIEYRAISGIPHADMPAAYGWADVILDSFRSGGYGVATCEGLATGRLVIAHVADRMRTQASRTFGEELPVVEATVETLEQVLRDIPHRLEYYSEIAAKGPGFVERNHDGTRSGRILSDWVRDILPRSSTPLSTGEGSES